MLFAAMAVEQAFQTQINEPIQSRPILASDLGRIAFLVFHYLS